jgi:hypothetical protein
VRILFEVNFFTCSNESDLSSSRSSFSDFSHKYAKDERFRGVEKTRERESLFNEFIVEIRRREKDERDAQREKVSTFFLSGECSILFIFIFEI